MKPKLKPKERLLHTASRLFHQKGYNSTGINEIIKDCKVAKASFYLHYKSKEELAIAYLQNRHEYWCKKLEDYVETGKTGKQKVLLAFDYIMHLNDTEKFRGCSFLNILSEIQRSNVRINKILQDHKTEVQHFFSKWIADASLSFTVYMLFEASIIESRLYQDQSFVRRAKTIVSKLIA